MLATGLTPILILGFFCFYIDNYGIPDKVRQGLMSIPYLNSLDTRLTVHVLIALISSITIGVFGVLTARSIISPLEKAKRMVEMICKLVPESLNQGGEPVPSKNQHAIKHNEIGMLLRFFTNTIWAIRLKQHETEKKLTNLQETNRFKTEFVSNITCELRNHLTLILGPVTSLLETPPQSVSEEDMSFLKMIKENALELKKTIYKLVAFSRHAVGAVHEPPIEFDGEPSSVPLKERIEAEFADASSISHSEPFASSDTQLATPTLSFLRKQESTSQLPTPEGDSDAHKYTILIVEDDADMIVYLRYVLKENFNPIFAANEHEAMERLKETPVNLVIVDVAITGTVPESLNQGLALERSEGMDSPVSESFNQGYELCRKVKNEVSPRFMPVVILTPKGGATMRIMGLEAGADCYITKPFEKRELLARLKTLSTQKELFDSIHERNTQLRRAENLRTEFVATMSHELRTPLSSILLATELLLDEISGKVNEEQKKQLGIIYMSCQNLLRLINNVLTLSKINAGKMDVNVAEVNLNRLIDSVLKEISPLANEKGLYLQSNLCKVPVMMSDGDKIRQVLLNILSNAIKFTSFGGRIDIHTKIPDGLNLPRTTIRGMIEITIADTGIGIPPDAIDSIFEEYRQVKVTGKQRIEGVGLGLSITKKLVKLLGGEIWAKSKLGEGTVFTFTLPLTH